MKKRNMRKTLPALCISLFALCCICVFAQDYSDGKLGKALILDGIVAGDLQKRRWERQVSSGTGSV
jgi:hypothetical protein